LRREPGFFALVQADHGTVSSGQPASKVASKAVA